VSPRKHPFKILYEVQSRVNNDSPPSPGGVLRRHHVPTNPRRASVYFTFHHSTQATGSGDATGSLYLALYVIIFIELNSNFMSLFTYLSLMWSITFSLSRHLFELCNPVANESP
jgi:hypothetical protein